MKKLKLFTTALALALAGNAAAQSEIYPQHFDLNEVTLLDGPVKTMLETNNDHLLQYDADRLMTPFIRQAGLSKKSSSKYYGWETKHPSFSNWGLSDWSLEGHVGGHYMSALALAYAATNDATMKAKMKERLDYCLAIMKDCQDAYANNTKGLKGFIGGQPINQIWTGLYAADLTEFSKYGGWVPFYCQHKVLAGLRDAYLYAGSDLAKELFRGLSDWSVNVVSNLSTSQMQQVLGWEHGGMNETLVDAYKIFNDKKYLDAAKKYSHQHMIDGMKNFSATFLDGKHANTQVPKYIGFERVWQEDNTVSSYRKSVLNFWNDVAQNRTVCIGGNSISEHFQSHDKGHLYISNLEGPESCNSNNMLKLSENLFDDTHDVRYADFYEATMWNHIMSTQDPTTGGYVYFTSLRPQSYRIYSQVNQGMWCCVGTGMENHSKYGHFIYTHSITNDTLYVNLFTASELNSEKFGIRQETKFPYEQKTQLTITKDGTFTLAIRQPSWASKDGKGCYTFQTKAWKKGDVVEVPLPMSLRYEPCPDYTGYIAFKYGPILLAARTETEAQLPNEYAGEGRMDHSPGARANAKPLSTAPLLIGNRGTVLQNIKETDLSKLQFTLTTSNQGDISLEPFYGIHHSRYSCYFFQGTEEEYADSEMGKKDAEEAALAARTLDFVATGEQQSEAGHQAKYSAGSTSGSFRGEIYRDGQANGYVQYVVENTAAETTNVSLMLRLITADKGRSGSIYIDNVKIADVTVASSMKNADENGFYNIEYRIPDELLLDREGNVKQKLTFKIIASSTTLLPGLYYLRLLKDYDDHAYRWNANDWITGDAGRVAQSQFTYNEDNTITIKSGTGTNNLCLTLNHEQADDYLLQSSQKYLAIVATNTKTTSGSAFLWWLNGVNKGSSVSPTRIKRLAQGTCFIWDMTQSGIDDNNSGDTFSICKGATIFGLTSSTGTSVIKYIGFHSTLDDIEQAVSIQQTPSSPFSSTLTGNYYTLGGIPSNQTLPYHIYVTEGKKVLVKQ
ncbi:MAG: glycoside hydrolase family 127 protein [Bacteroidaceae bacterium]|nr:glycoside hydrolase family 127 protein [Bacteroidaceae bacterium]